MKMDENIRKGIIFSTLALIWVGLILLIMAPSFGLANPVFPRPQPDYELMSMLISGALLMGYSLKTGISYLKST
jgi:hypothetical protein